MSQIVRIECSNCEAVEEYEFDGCIVLGWKEGGLFYKAHEATLGGLLDEIFETAIKVINEMENNNKQNARGVQ